VRPPLKRDPLGSTHLGAVPKQDPLILEIQSSHGEGVLRASIDHPLVAAFRRGFEEGQTTGSWRFFAVTRRAEPPIVVGYFVHTPKGRVLFFPSSEIQIFTDDPTARFNGKLLDHVTLDRARGGRHASHIAARGVAPSTSRGRNRRSRLPGSTAPWFSLLTTELDAFPMLPARLSVEFPPPRTDVAAYGQELVASGGVRSVQLLPPSSEGPDYVQFDVWVGRGKDWQASPVHPLAWAYKPEIVADPPAHRQNVTVNRVDVTFTTELGLALVHTRPRGRLLSPRLLRPTLKEYANIDW
jgi:hypothetical protein